jgi:hypothetical protein
MYLPAVILFASFSSLAAFDVIFIHGFQEGLHTRKDSRQEHLLHTLQSGLFARFIYLVFLVNFSGMFLWLGVLVTLATIGVSLWDAAIEKKSRQGLGGLSSLEYVFHLIMEMTRTAAVAWILALKPESSWHWDALPLAHYPSYFEHFAQFVFVLSILFAIWHVWLSVRYKPSL